MANQSVRPGEVDDDAIRTFNQIATFLTELKTDYNALLAKLDADAGVTDTNYASLRAISSAVPDTFTENY